VKASGDTAAVVLSGVARRYRIDERQTITALDGVDLAVEQGSVVALWGPSGSGKSTLLQLVGGLDRPDRGTIDVQGGSLGELSGKQLAAYRRRVGFVFQRYNLLPALTVIDNVMAPVLPYRVDFDKQARARELLATVGLEGREDALPSHLSGGQQQRVAIARALINQPPLVLADEPTGNLDSRTGAAIIDLLLELRLRSKVTILLATHDPRVAGRCDRVVGLSDGRVVSDTDVSDADALASVLAGAPAPGGGCPPGDAS
jgi:putative ABC transport system ATP-binding protein